MAGCESRYASDRPTPTITAAVEIHHSTLTAVSYEAPAAPGDVGPSGSYLSSCGWPSSQAVGVASWAARPRSTATSAPIPSRAATMVVMTTKIWSAVTWNLAAVGGGSAGRRSPATTASL